MTRAPRTREMALRSAVIQVTAYSTLWGMFSPATAVVKPQLYALATPTPYETVDAKSDAEFNPGDIVVVSGFWQRGGTAGGAVLACSVETPTRTRGALLNKPPVKVRYFYLDVLPPGAPATPEGGGWVTARGLIADEGLYGYGYILRADEVKLLPAPVTTEELITASREALTKLRPRIKKIKLDTITNAPHHPFNKNYKIKADPAEAEVTLENADLARGIAVARARLERLPPRDSEVLYRYLDVYLIIDLATKTIPWTVVCVGGFVLE